MKSAIKRLDLGDLTMILDIYKGIHIRMEWMITESNKNAANRIQDDEVHKASGSIKTYLNDEAE